MAAWGDNTYGQLNVPSVENLNGDLHLLEMKSGYNHNVAIFYDDAIDYVDQISSVNLLDTLYVGIVYGGDSVIARQCSRRLSRCEYAFQISSCFHTCMGRQ